VAVKGDKNPLSLAEAGLKKKIGASAQPKTLTVVII
jgi:hypothetical protein